MAEQQEIQLWQTVEPVEFIPRIKDQSESQSLLIQTRQAVGYSVAGGQLAHAIQARATHMLLDYTKAACAIRYQVDGAWEQLPAMERELGDAMLVALKQLCLMNATDRRSTQSGKLGLKVVKEKFSLSLQSRGTPTGEQVMARIEPDKVPFQRMADLGMRDKMYAQFKESLDAHGNNILITAPKSEGLTTTWNIAMEAADKLVRDFQSFEHQDNPEPEIININPNFFGGDTDKDLPSVVKSAILKEPDVLIFPELPDSASMKLAVEQIKKTDKQVYSRMVAPSALHGLVKYLAKYRESAAEIVSSIGAVLGQRLVRRLCDECKEGFEPSPQLLKQLGIPAGRVAMLYRPFVPPPIEQQVDENGRPAPIEPCQACNGRGYLGRIAIYELLIPGEKLKAALLKTQDINKLTQIAKSEGHRSMQAESVLTVARGLTSLDELKKAFAKR